MPAGSTVPLDPARLHSVELEVLVPEEGMLPPRERRMISLNRKLGSYLITLGWLLMLLNQQQTRKGCIVLAGLMDPELGEPRAGQ